MPLYYAWILVPTTESIYNLWSLEVLGRWILLPLDRAMLAGSLFPVLLQNEANRLLAPTSAPMLLLHLLYGCMVAPIFSSTLCKRLNKHTSWKRHHCRKGSLWFWQTSLSVHIWKVFMPVLDGCTWIRGWKACCHREGQDTMNHPMGISCAQSLCTKAFMLLHQAVHIKRDLSCSQTCSRGIFLKFSRGALFRECKCTS